MTNEAGKPSSVSDPHVPPPMDPYARYQTPYERRSNASTEPNPFIKFRRFADKQLASFFDDLPRFSQMFGLADERQRFREQWEEEMKDFKEQMPRMEEALRYAIVSSVADEKAKRVNTVMPEEPMSIQRQVDKVDLPSGWVQTMDSNGTKYYIDPIGRASKNMPAKVSQDDLPSNKYESGLPRHDLHPNGNSTSRQPDNLLSEQLVARSSGLKDAEGAQGWQRGLRNCPELKKYRDESELDVYERHDDHDDTPERTMKGQAEFQRRRRGYEKCTGLQDLDPETELDLYEQFDQREVPEERPHNNQPLFTPPRSNGFFTSVFDLLPSMGHDGRQLVRSFQQSFKELDENVRANDDPVMTEYNDRVQKVVQKTIENTTYNHGIPFTSSIMAAIDDQESKNDRYKQASPRRHNEVYAPRSLLPSSPFDLFSNHMLPQMIEVDDLDLNMDELWQNTSAEVKGLWEEAFNEQLREEEELEKHFTQHQPGQSRSLSEYSEKKERKSSIVSTMTRTTSRTLPDGSVETTRVLKKRFADGREESEESTDITQKPRTLQRVEDAIGAGQQKPGWFWN